MKNYKPILDDLFKKIIENISEYIDLQQFDKISYYKLFQINFLNFKFNFYLIFTEYSLNEDTIYISFQPLLNFHPYNIKIKSFIFMKISFSDKLTKINIEKLLDEDKKIIYFNAILPVNYVQNDFDTLMNLIKNIISEISDILEKIKKFILEVENSEFHFISLFEQI